MISKLSGIQKRLLYNKLFCIPPLQDPRVKVFLYIIASLFIIQIAKKQFSKSQSNNLHHGDESEGLRSDEFNKGSGPSCYKFKNDTRLLFGANPDRRYQYLDPFAIKISIPPLVLFVYVVYKYISAPDIRFEMIRKAELRHFDYMNDLNEERTSSEELRNLSKCQV